MEQKKTSIAVAIENLQLVYKNKCKVFSNYSIQFEQNKFHVLMGPSGSGKTSLLGLIAGRVKKTSGEIKVNGRVATIHQDLRLVLQRSAIENVLHGALHKYSSLKSFMGFSEEDITRATELLCRVGLCNKIHERVGHLSGGQRQRVAIARALMQNPEIVLADEPVGALDEPSANAIMKLLKDIAREHSLTVICVLHDAVLAAKYADSVIGLQSDLYHQKSQEEKILSVQKSDSYKSRLPIVTIEPEIAEYTQVFSSAKVKELSKKNEKNIKRNSYIFLAVLVFFWSLLSLDISRRELLQAGDGFILFLFQLVPSSFAELQAMPWSVLLFALVETMQMAFVGTVFGVIISWPIAALASNNVSPNIICISARFILNVIRTVPSLIWALLFVAAVGLGTLAGILALVAYTIGYLAKFFYEAFEGVDPGPPDALKELGAKGLQRFYYAIWPAAKPAVLSSCFFMLEYNIRAASVLGVVDAGGIGFFIRQYIDYRAFPIVFVALALLLLLVIFFDSISAKLRKSIIRE